MRIVEYKHYEALGCGDCPNFKPNEDDPEEGECNGPVCPLAKRMFGW